MTKTSPPQVAFSAGELDPLLHARFDYQRFQTGMDTCRGYLPLPQGGFTRGPGTTYLGAPRALSSTCFLIPFQFAADDAVVLEFTPGFMRVWRYGQLVQNSAGTGPYELATPYVTAADLEGLRWVQSADAIYLVNGLRLPQRLVRLALNSWTIGIHILRTGPFRVQNLDRSFTLSPSGLSDAITLTASAPLFTASMVAGLIQLKVTDNTTIPLWRVEDTSIAVGDLRRYGKNVYRFLAGTNTGAEPPIHDEGIQLYSDGRQWEYVSDDTGVVRITSITSPTEATVQVLKRLPDALLINPTYRWAEGAFSSFYGFPSSIEMFDQRLVFAATQSEPRTVWFSTVGDFADFTPSIEPDGAFAYTVAGSGSQNRITGLCAGRGGLHIFALSEEYSTRSENRTQVIGPTTASFGLDGTTGAREGRAIAPQGDPIFITRDGRALFLISYDFQQDANREVNLIRASKHLGEAGLKKVVWQQTPEPRAWLLRETGDLAVMIYDQSEDILGWSTHDVAANVIDLCVTQNADGTEDQVIMVVERSIGLTSYVYIEQLDFSHHLMSARVVDLRGSASPSITSLSAPWLANAQVFVEYLPAGADMPFVEAQPVVAADGAIPLEMPARYAVAGLLATGHRALTLDIQAAARDGNSMGRNKRLHPALTVVLHQTRGGKVRVIESHGPGMSVPAPAFVDLLDPGVGRDMAGPFTGLVEVQMPSGQAKRIQAEFTPIGNRPMTVLGIIPTIQEAGR